MQLSLRLSAIAEMVTEGSRLVDVGCDHGYLPVYLVLNHKIPGAIAMDVRKGPLSRAKEHLEEYGLGKYIETRLSDGLHALKPGEGDTLVIAGMGGPLMEKILTEGEAVLDGFQELILQPQSDIPHFRHFLSEKGWTITEEKIILEDGKFYPMMKAVRNPGKEVPVYSKMEEWFGKLLLKERNPVLKQYLERELGIRREILKKLAEAPAGSALERMKEIEEEKQLILAALKLYESS
ncbi:MAG: class I SAM-dependent methyltransferase [Eubacteriales bacterium]|nr:class I SAM-dependent methyltransferase [Eubacteriales bacterium]